MTRRLFLALAVALFCAGLLPAQQAKYQKNGPALLSDPAVTKGAVRLRSKGTVCAIKWGKDERHVTQKMRDDAYAQYGTAPDQGVCIFKTHTGEKGQPVTEGCKIDHLISRELGGDDTLENLWPQPYTQHPGAHEKDWLENELHKEVCAGVISLKDAQKEIKTDWYAAYSKRKDCNPNPNIGSLWGGHSCPSNLSARAFSLPTRRAMADRTGHLPFLPPWVTL